MPPVLLKVGDRGKVVKTAFKMLDLDKACQCWINMEFVPKVIWLKDMTFMTSDNSINYATFDGLDKDGFITKDEFTQVIIIAFEITYIFVLKYF